MFVMGKLMITIIICVIIGYFFGCITTGYLVGKIKHKNIQQEGSGNIGTTNALRTMGVSAALITFLGDICKAIVPSVVVRLIFREDYDLAYLFGICLGFGVVLGHNFPFWLKFKGGKGIAVTSAVVLALADWRVIVIGLLLFIGIVAVTRYVSLGSLVVVWYLPVNTLLFYRQEKLFPVMLLVSLFFTALAYIRHAPNIKRLIAGTERKLGEKAEENH